MARTSQVGWRSKDISDLIVRDALAHVTAVKEGSRLALNGVGDRSHHLRAGCDEKAGPDRDDSRSGERDAEA